MSFKEFLEKCIYQSCTPDAPVNLEGDILPVDYNVICVDDLFVFLWERGGKQFAKRSGVEIFDYINPSKFKTLRADTQDFLDCVAINEEEVKKRIKEMEK